MSNLKKDLAQFLVWMRNGVAVGISWILILWLIFGNMYGVESIAIKKLSNMVFFVIGGVFLFSVFFTRVIIKKWSFVTRLTCFILAAVVYECAVFYGTGFWVGSGSLAKWAFFVAPVLISYFICIMLYRRYSKKKGDIYTEALQRYQQERLAEKN